MRKLLPRVLVVATSRKTRGGISAVVKAHEKGEQWTEYGCRWIETHRDSSGIVKLYFFLKSFLQFALLLPFYNIVHIHVSEVVSARRKSFFIFFASFLGKKIIIHFHAFSPETTLKQYTRLYTSLFEKAQCVIVLSNQWKEWVNQYTNLTTNVVVVYNPCPTVVCNNTNIKSNVILFAGTLNERKGYDVLIKAFSRIAKRHPDWSVSFAGNGELGNAKILANELGIESQITFLGWINGKEKDKIFRSASIFCLPSYAEGFPMAVLDAWAYGLPVITTPVGGIPEIVEDKVNGLLFPPGNIETLSIQLDSLISDEVKREQLALKSKLLSETTFKLENINKQIGDIYKKVLFAL